MQGNSRTATTSLAPLTGSCPSYTAKRKDHTISFPEQTTGIDVAARISLDTLRITLNEGDTHQLTASITDVANTTVETVHPIVFRSQDSTVATVSTSGLVTAVSPGLTQVTVAYSPTLGVSFDAEANIVVSPPYPTSPPFSWLNCHWNGSEWVGKDTYATGTWDGSKWTPST